MLELFITLILGTADIAICFDLFSRFFESRIRSIPKMILTAAGFLCILFINQLVLKSFRTEEMWMYYERTWVTIISGTGICFIVFRGKPLELIMMFTVFYICEVMAESLIMLVFIIMRFDYKHLVLKHEIIIPVMQKILTFAVAKIIQKTFKFRHRRIEGKLFMSMIFLPLITISIGIYLYRMKVTTPQDEFFVTAAIPLLISCNLLVFAVIEKVSRLQYEHYELEILRSKTEMEKQYYDHLDEIEQKQVSVRHDIKHYISVMKILLEENNTEELKRLLLSFEGGMNKITPETHTKNRMLNVILSDKKETAKKNGILLDLNIEVNTDISYISDLDSIALFGNLMDNAIRAEKESTGVEKIIELRLFETDGNFNVLNIRNHFSKIERRDGNFITTKKDDGFHGVGLKSVQSIVNKYNGIFSVEIIEEEGTRIFEANICLPKKHVVFS